MLELVKDSMRIDGDEHDVELMSLIASAEAMLMETGVLLERIMEEDPLIQRAVVAYCKASFGVEDDYAERYMESFEEMRTFLSLNHRYTEVVDI